MNVWLRMVAFLTLRFSNRPSYLGAFFIFTFSFRISCLLTVEFVLKVYWSEGKTENLVWKTYLDLWHWHGWVTLPCHLSHDVASSPPIACHSSCSCRFLAVQLVLMQLVIFWLWVVFLLACALYVAQKWFEYGLQIWFICGLVIGW